MAELNDDIGLDRSRNSLKRAHAVLISHFNGSYRPGDAPTKLPVLHRRAGYFLPVNLRGLPSAWQRCSVFKCRILFGTTRTTYRSHIEPNMLGGCGFISFMLSRRFFAESVKCSCKVANIGCETKCKLSMRYRGMHQSRCKRTGQGC